MNTLNVYEIIDNTMVEGPGRRTCIFLQGCLKHCYNCNSPQTWDLSTANQYTIEELANKILKNKTIEGVTYSGGEPLLQSKALYDLSLLLIKEGLSIVVFTGYSYDIIKKVNNANWNNLLSITDILITEPFIYEKRTSHKLWVGSTNQQYHFLSNKYKYLKNNLKNKKNKIEIRLNKDGSIIVNGMADNESIKKIFKKINEI